MLLTTIYITSLVVGPPRTSPLQLAATSKRTPSLLNEMWEKLSWPQGGESVYYEMREEMVEAFAGIAGDADSAEITLDQFSTLLAQGGDDDLPPEKVRAMFESVDTNGDGLIEYVKYYKACLDEARSRKRGGGVGNFFSMAKGDAAEMVRKRTRPPQMMAIGSDGRAASKQVDAYYALAPWEKFPEINEKFGKRLDLRGFIQPFDRGGCVLASVIAAQDGAPLSKRRGKSPLAKLDNAPGGPWRVVGNIAAPDEASLSTAIATQRPLIEAWAIELVRDFDTDSKVLRKGIGASPIKLAWILPKSAFDFTWPDGAINEVPQSEKADEGVPCGFLGTQCRSVKGAKGGFRFEQIELR